MRWNGTGSTSNDRRAVTLFMRRDDPFAQVVVPAHQIIDTGTLGGVLDGAELSVEDFVKAL